MSLFEILIVLVVVSIGLKLAIPTYLHLNGQQILLKEQQSLHAFLRKIQLQAEITNDIWFILANRDLLTQTWCITAQRKNEQLCNCLQPHTCTQSEDISIYRPFFSEVQLSTNRYYPKEITRLGSARDTAQSNCFVLQHQQYYRFFIFSNVGGIKISPHLQSSVCKRYITGKSF